MHFSTCLACFSFFWTFLFPLSSSFILDKQGVPTFSSGTNLGNINDHENDEASGLASSHLHPTVHYIHNDKTDTSRIFALDNHNGHTIAGYNITHAHNYDCEDVAVGVCPNNSHKSCIYIGDMRDHFSNGSAKIIYVVQEPTHLQNGNLDPVVALHYLWNVENCNTLVIDPQGNVLIVSKGHGSKEEVGLIPASAFQQNSTYHIVHSANVNLPITSHSPPEGGDLSPNGEEILLRTNDALFYWYVDDGDYVRAMSTVKPIRVPHAKELKSDTVA